MSDPNLAILKEISSKDLLTRIRAMTAALKHATTIKKKSERRGQDNTFMAEFSPLGDAVRRQVYTTARRPRTYSIIFSPYRQAAQRKLVAAWENYAAPSGAQTRSLPPYTATHAPGAARAGRIQPNPPHVAETDSRPAEPGSLEPAVSPEVTIPPVPTLQGAESLVPASQIRIEAAAPEYELLEVPKRYGTASLRELIKSSGKARVLAVDYKKEQSIDVLVAQGHAGFGEDMVHHLQQHPTQPGAKRVFYMLRDNGTGYDMIERDDLWDDKTPNLNEF